jgi:hypothetical protein
MHGDHALTDDSSSDYLIFSSSTVLYEQDRQDHQVSGKMKFELLVNIRAYSLVLLEVFVVHDDDGGEEEDDGDVVDDDEPCSE